MDDALPLPRPLASGRLVRVAAAAWPALASGLLGWLADYPRPIPFLAWVAPVPVLVAALRRGPRDACWLGLLWGLGATAATWQALDAVAMPLGATAAMVAARTTMMAAVLVGTVALARATSMATAGWVFGGLTALAEWVSQPAGLGLWWNTATTQASVDWLRAVAAVGGPFLVSLLVACGAGTLAVLALSRGRGAVLAALTAAAAIGGAVWAGARAVPVATSRARVAAVVHALPAEVRARWDRREVAPGETSAALDGYAALTRRAAVDGAAVVVWPEYGIFLHAADRSGFEMRVAALARETRTVVVAGFIDVDAGRNAALLATPEGQVHAYAKRRLVPGFETSWIHPGDEAFATATGRGLRVASQICYDAAFTAGARAAAGAGMDLLAVPARHWRGIEEAYPMWQVYRATESGRAMVQAARDGVSMIVDPGGRVLAAAPDRGRDVLLVADVPIARGTTPYGRAGDWPVAIAALGLAGLAARALSRRAARPRPSS